MGGEGRCGALARRHTSCLNVRVHVEVPGDYDGPVMPDNKRVTRGFMEALLEHFRAQKSVPVGYAIIVSRGRWG